jgi:hypothetical protein
LRIKATLLLIISLLTAANAQLKVSLQFESAGPREVFVSKAVPTSAPDGSIKATGAGLDYPLPGFADSDRLFVWDRTTNNLASIPVKDIKGGSWAPKAGDFNLIGLVTVRIEHKGAAVQAAKVKLTSKSKSEEKLLDPSGDGNVTFFGYPAGEFRVKVGYNTLDKKSSSVEQIYPVEVKRDKAEPVLTVAIADEVATVAPGAQPPGGAVGNLTPKNGAKPAGEAGTTAETGPGGKIVIILVSLVVIGGIAWYVLQLAKKDPKVFEDNLKKLGVQIPNQQDPDAAIAPVPVTPLPPAGPPPQILLDDSNPTPLGAGAGPVIAPIAGAAASEPTLVKETGERFTFIEGESLVGREDGLPVSLAGESTVSRRHASLIRNGSAAILKDLGSTNGTFVNGTRLVGEQTLKPGDQVQFGSVRFRYEG